MNTGKDDDKVKIANYTKKQLHMYKTNVMRKAKTYGKWQFIMALKFDNYINYLIKNEKNTRVNSGYKLIKEKLESIEDRKLLHEGEINTYRTNKILALFNTSLNQTEVMTIKKSETPSTLTCREVLDIINKDKDAYELILNSFIKLQQAGHMIKIAKTLIDLDTQNRYKIDLLKEGLKEFELIKKNLTD